MTEFELRDFRRGGYYSLDDPDHILIMNCRGYPQEQVVHQRLLCGHTAVRAYGSEYADYGWGISPHHVPCDACWVLKTAKDIANAHVCDEAVNEAIVDSIENLLIDVCEPRGLKPGADDDGSRELDRIVEYLSDFYDWDERGSITLTESILSGI